MPLKTEVWDHYWETNSSMNSFAFDYSATEGPYARINEFWVRVFEQFTSSDTIVDLGAGNGALAHLFLQNKELQNIEKWINIDSANTSDILYQVKNDKLPRYVKFSFKPARDPFAKIEANMTTIIRDNLAQLIIEGAGSTKYHTGIELLDTGLEKNIYSMLSGSITFIESVSDKDSPLSAAGKLEKELNEKGGLVGKSKKIGTLD